MDLALTRGRPDSLRVERRDQIARFFDQSTATKTFQRGMDANNHPGFYRQLGKDPQELVAAALALLQKRFDLR
jgi:hypothetical protein